MEKIEEKIKGGKRKVAEVIDVDDDAEEAEEKMIEEEVEEVEEEECRYKRETAGGFFQSYGKYSAAFLRHN